MTLAETELHALLLGADGADLTRVEASYREAGALRPPPGDVDSSLWQLAWLERMGVDHEAIATAAGALRRGAR